MKSREQMGGSPEQPKKEQVEDEKIISEKPEFPESYDKTQWEKLKNETDGPSLILREGKKIGVPQEELNLFTDEIIAIENDKQNYDFVYRFMKNSEVLYTDQEIKDSGEQAYKLLLEIEDYKSAMSVAENLYGKNSNEWNMANEADKKRIQKINEERRENKDQRLEITISTDATFAELFNALDSNAKIKKEFIDSMWNNFDENGIAEEITAFQDNLQIEKATDIKVLDFFTKRNFSQKNVSDIFPIKFI